MNNLMKAALIWKVLLATALFVVSLIVALRLIAIPVAATDAKGRFDPLMTAQLKGKKKTKLSGQVVVEVPIWRYLSLSIGDRDAPNMGVNPVRRKVLLSFERSSGNDHGRLESVGLRGGGAWPLRKGAVAESARDAHNSILLAGGELVLEVPGHRPVLASLTHVNGYDSRLGWYAVFRSRDETDVRVHFDHQGRPAVVFEEKAKRIRLIPQKDGLTKYVVSFSSSNTSRGIDGVSTQINDEVWVDACGIGNGFPTEGVSFQVQILFANDEIRDRSAGAVGLGVGVLRELFANTSREWLVEEIIEPESLGLLESEIKAFIKFTSVLQGNGGNVEAARRRSPLGGESYGRLSERVGDNRRGPNRVAVLITSDTASAHCGIAAGIPWNSRQYYALVNERCLADGTLAHEVGHLLGARHEVHDDGTGVRSAHGFSWADFEMGNYVGDIMATKGKKLPWFSTPTVTCRGNPIGSSEVGNNLTEVLKTLGKPERYPMRSNVCGALVGRSDPSHGVPRCYTKTGSAVYFDVGSARISSEENGLEEYLLELRKNGVRAIAVAGFADRTGGFRKNLDLALLRAQALEDRLQGKWPLNEDEEVHVCTYGSEFQHCGGDAGSPDGLTMDRRAEIISLY